MLKLGIKKELVILLAVFYVVSLTAATASADHRGHGDCGHGFGDSFDGFGNLTLRFVFQ